MRDKEIKPLIYACSGCSNAGQMSNWIAVRIDRLGGAEMSCMTGVGGDVPALVNKARLRKKIVIEGCKLSCASACLRQRNLEADMTLNLQDQGVVRREHEDFDQALAEKLVEQVVAQMRAKKLWKSSFEDGREKEAASWLSKPL